MSPRAQLCRAFVVLYVVFLMLLTLDDIRAFQAAMSQSEFWPTMSVHLLRLVILAAFAWKILKGSGRWILVLGVFLALVALVSLAQLCLGGHSPAPRLVLVAGSLRSRAAVLWAFCVAPALGAACCLALARDCAKGPAAPRGA